MQRPELAGVDAFSVSMTGRNMAKREKAVRASVLPGQDDHDDERDDGDDEGRETRRCTGRAGRRAPARLR